MKIILFLTSLCFYSLTFSQSTMNYQKYIVHFDFGKSSISTSELKKWKEFEAQLPSDYKINELKAHTDTVSSEEFNLNLAKKRLASVMELLSINYSTIETVIGERDAQKSTNYNDAEFRIVEINYLLIPQIIDEPTIVIEKSELSKTAESLANSKSGETIEFDLSVLFEPGLPVFLPSSYNELNELLETMQNYPTMNIIIHGHVCCASEPELAINRAKAVYSYLIRNNISSDRMKFVGHDNTRPKVTPERTEEDRIANRRVSIEFIKQ